MRKRRLRRNLPTSRALYLALRINPNLTRKIKAQPVKVAHGAQSHTRVEMTNMLESSAASQQIFSHLFEWNCASKMKQSSCSRSQQRARAWRRSIYRALDWLTPPWRKFAQLWKTQGLLIWAFISIIFQAPRWEVNQVAQIFSLFYAPTLSILSELAKAVGNSARLATLQIDTPHTRSSGSFGVAAQAIFQSVAKSTSITSLKIAGTQNDSSLLSLKFCLIDSITAHDLTDNAALGAAGLLQRNTRLLVLDLSSNPFGEEGAIFSLQRSCVTRSNLQNTHSSGCHALFKSLASNSTLKGLILESVPLSDKSLSMLTRTLTHQNTTISRLDISKNLLLPPQSSKWIFVRV